MDKWLGGACPVEPGTVVEFELRDGTRSQSRAGLLRWRHLDPAHPKDVVAFRAVDLEEQVRPASALDTQEGGDHYKTLGDYQPWQVLAKWMTPEELRGFAKGTAVAYLAREQQKGGRLDIKKAVHTLQIYLELTEGEQC